MEEKEVQALLENDFPNSDIAIVDTRGSGDHFEIMVVSDNFEGVPILERHKMIHSALGDNLGGAIHAVEIKAYTKKQWENVS